MNTPLANSYCHCTDLDRITAITQQTVPSFRAPVQARREEPSQAMPVGENP